MGMGVAGLHSRRKLGFFGPQSEAAACGPRFACDRHCRGERGGVIGTWILGLHTAIVLWTSAVLRVYGCVGSRCPRATLS